MAAVHLHAVALFAGGIIIFERKDLPL